MTNRLSDAELQKLRELEAKATDSKWFIDRLGLGTIGSIEDDDGDCIAQAMQFAGRISDPLNKIRIANAEFIVAARNAIIPLLDEIAELRKNSERREVQIAHVMNLVGHKAISAFSWTTTVAKAIGERDALRLEIAELRRDKTRLDWYLANRTKITQWINPMNGHGWRLLVDGRYESEGSTQRDALDAAMQESENAVQEEGE